MELHQIRYFIAVAERLSYSKAARELHISVSPLSRQIRQLEEEFGVRLFARDRRRVELTDAGRLFLQEAKALIHHTVEVSDRLRLASRGEVGVVKVGVAMHLGDRAGSVVAEHARRYPAVDIQCKCIYSTQQNAALRESQIDIGFLRAPVDPALASEPLYEERLVAVMGKTNALAKSKLLRVKDLAGETLFLPDPSVGSGLRDKILELYAKAGVAPHISPMAADLLSPHEVYKILLAANKGIFIVADEASLRADSSNVAVVVPIDDPDARIDVHMAWRKDEKSATVLAVVNTARKMLADSQASVGARFAAVRPAMPSQSATSSGREGVSARWGRC
jgi:DNA-binding transcriptional LysR family regulator